MAQSNTHLSTIYYKGEKSKLKYDTHPDQEKEELEGIVGACLCELVSAAYYLSLGQQEVGQANHTPFG